MLARSIAVGALVLAGCYDVPTPVCGFACTQESECPVGYTCMRTDDGRCHLNGYESVTCKDAPFVPTDDTTPPFLVSHGPQSSTEPTQPLIDVMFSERVLHVNESTFILTKDGPAPTKISASVVALDNGFQWTLDPTLPLEFGASYTVELTTAITDQNGNHFAGFSYSFGVMIDGSPMIDFGQFNQPTPNAVGVPVNTFVTVTMTEQVLTLAGKFRLVIGTSGPEAPTVLDNVGLTSQATLELVEQLQPQTLYSVQVDADVTDTTGNQAGVPMGWSFTTGDDFIPPALRETSPKMASVAPVDTTISVLFDEPVSGITQFRVSNGATMLPGMLASENGGRTWTFTPDAPLPANVTISVAITAASDFSGNTQNFTFNFMTAP